MREARIRLKTIVLIDRPETACASIREELLVEVGELALGTPCTIVALGSLLWQPAAALTVREQSYKNATDRQLKARLRWL